jgi:hypothetical protein
MRKIIPVEELKGAWANDPSIDEAMEQGRKLWKNSNIQNKSLQKRAFSKIS